MKIEHFELVSRGILDPVFWLIEPQAFRSGPRFDSRQRHLPDLEERFATTPGRPLAG
jgi:hypothetical protein